LLLFRSFREGETTFGKRTKGGASLLKFAIRRRKRKGKKTHGDFADASKKGEKKKKIGKNH